MQRHLFALAWPLSAVFLLASAPWLPEWVGDAGKQAPRAVFVGLMLFSVALVGLCSAPFIRWLGRRAPQQINMPHRDYWLAPERREATLQHMGEHLSGLGLLLLALLSGIQGYALMGGQSARFWLAGAIGLGLLLVGWLRQTYRRFPAPPLTESAADLRRQPRRPRRPH